MLVNDRSVSVLENYDFEVIRTQKSRNAILCETNKGRYILKEYKGPVFRLEMMAKVLEGVRQNGFTRAEQLLSTKEGALFCCDQEQNRCIVKSWPQGRECSLKDGQECRDAMRTRAVLHSALHFPQLQQESGLHAVSLAEEYEKRIEQAENSFLFEIRLLSEEYDLKDPAGKTEFANETAKKLLQFSFNM